MSAAATSALSAALSKKFILPVRARVRDGPYVAALLFFRLARINFIWIVLFMVDRYYQDLFVQRTMVMNKPPPCLWRIILWVLLADAVFMALLALMVLFLKGRFKTDKNSYVLDSHLLAQVVTEYAFSTIVVALFGMAAGVVVQSKRYFRYKDDGLRAIRAHCVLLLLTSAPIIALQPM